MNRIAMLSTGLAALLSCLGTGPGRGATPPAPVSTPALDTSRIEELTGLKGTYIESENVFKVTAPRADVPIAVDGWTMPPFMGLTSWAAFQTHGEGVMVMGDLVLFEDEVNPVMSAALDNGLEVTALHNHFFFDQPRVFFMHIGGHGSAETLAAGVGKALAAMKAVRADHAKPATSFGAPVPSPSSIDAKPLEAALGVTGQAKDGMFKAVIGRTTSMAGATVGKEMGVNTWAAFAGSSTDAVVDGDFAVAERELQSVLRALRRAGIHIVAIHHHMSGEAPKILFLHYWGRGNALALARGVRTALDAAGADSNAAPPGRATLAQALADQMARDHSDLARIGLHVTPPGAADNIIIASNVAAKIGQKSDPEDMAAMTTGRAVVLREGENFDVTLPLHDASGKVIGAVGLTLRPGAPESEGAALQRAEVLARGLEKRISSLESLFAPTPR